jgi:sulfite exporter TauE/SafE/copper chaperone CopZ
MQSIILKIDGMTCVNCENRIEKMLKNTKGIIDTVVSYSSGTAEITYDENLIGIENIIEIIDGQGYKVVKETKEKANQRASLTKALGIAIILLSLYMIISRFGVFNVFNAFPQAEETTGYGMLFIIGLLTSLHCVAMCGGINLSQCVLQDTQKSNTLSKIAVLTPSFLYNLGRVLSYTIIGGIVGAVGSVAGFSGALKGVVQIAAGVFMVIMGLNMLNIFPWLRKFNPRMPKIFAKKINERKKSKSPLYVGLLNGLMPCGPLQAMQLYALSTGSPIKGAVSMLLFSLGTVPLMFGLGALSSFLSKKFTRKIMTVSTVLVIVLGVSMFAGGISLSGISFSAFAAEINTSARNMNVANISDNVQIVTTKLSSGSYEPITVQKGIPVKWIIKAEKKDMNGCNNEIVIPKFNIVKRLEIGDNIIEFTPTESGTFAYSCWMGMIRSKITVVDDFNNREASEEDPAEKKSDYKIPIDSITVAQIIDGKQTVSIDMVADRFTPAVIATKSCSFLHITRKST